MTRQITCRLEDPQAYLCQILQTTRKVIADAYQLHRITIRVMKPDGSRLSTTIKIQGLNKKQRKEQYFGKIIGNSDILTFRSLQLLKNLYLQIHDQEPLFETFDTPQEFASTQYKLLNAMYKHGFSTACPYGCHRLQEAIWLLVEEFVSAPPLSELTSVTSAQMDQVFRYIHRLHKKKLFHGDIKPDNLLLGDTIYIMDVGNMRKDAPAQQKRAYDLASLLCCFLSRQPVGEIIRVARRYYPRKDLLAATDYVELVQLRPDFHFDNEMKQTLLSELFR